MQTHVCAFGFAEYVRDQLLIPPRLLCRVDQRLLERSVPLNKPSQDTFSDFPVVPY